MPCYQITQFTVQSFNLKSKEILIKALEQLKIGFVETEPNIIRIYSSKTMLLNLNESTAKYTQTDTELFLEIKQKYSVIVLETAAKKKNWMLKKIATNQYRAVKF